MKRILLILVALLFNSGAVQASEYAAFTRDLIKPYDHLKKSLSLTTKKEDADKAMAAVAAFVDTWTVFAARYAQDPPGPLAGINDFPARIRRPVEVGKQAADYLKTGNVARAHSILEEVRYLMWEMRVKSGIVSLSDKANDFHEAMEVLLELTAAAKEPEDAKRIYERYAAWLMIKWEDHANAADITSVKSGFDRALTEGRIAIISYLDALKKGDVTAAKKLTGGVKNGYKTLWGLDNQ